jgi:DNA-binding LytR/AlgR family response regulator
MIDCLIIDDEPVARSIIRNYCSHLGFVHVIAECSNAFEAKEILTNRAVDLIFLDIHMPVLNGLAFFHTLKDPPQVILTTAFEEYAVKAFDIAACDYLLKPFSLERFMIAVDKAKEKIVQDHFFIKADGKIYRIANEDCLYAEAQGNYTKVQTVHTSHLTNMSFSTFIDLLPKGLFIRIHRSFLVNKNKISHIEGNRVIVGKKELPIALNYKPALFSVLGLSSQ